MSTKSLKTLFTKHPHEVGMNYSRHCRYAFSVMLRLFGCGLACSIHAFFPFLFTHTTSDTVKKLNEDFNHRMMN